MIEHEHLTPRELDILRLICQGCSNKEIAQQLVLSVGTVKWYNKQIFQKLDVSSRTQAAIKARELHIVPRDQHRPVQPIPRHNLPYQLTSFVGRKRELGDVQKLLRTSRLLTLTGAPGAGKTRLAIEVAQNKLDDYSDGVWFVALASLQDAELVMPTIARTLKIRTEQESSVSGALENYLRGRQLLLVLDNFEHVLSAASDLTQLLEKVPTLTALVTSREILNVYGEQEYQVLPLQLPPFELEGDHVELYTNEAIQMFVGRAKAVAPGFTLTPENAMDVAAICVHLDGLPLAIELAASRIKLFSPAILRNQLNDRFGTLTGGARDFPPRMQTLQNALDWSWQLLSSDEQVFFSRLGIFVGGFSHAAADTICRQEQNGPSTVDLLMSLVNKSLVHNTLESESRFAMLETVREFALQQLTINGEADRMRNHHADYYVNRVQQVYQKRRERNDRFLQLIEDFEDERGNLHAVLHWLLATHDNERALCMIGGLADFWWLYGYATEGLQWAERALTASPQAMPVNRAQALRARGLLLYETGQFEKASETCREAAEVFRDLGDTFELAWMLAYLGAIYDELYDQRASSLLSEALALFHEIDSPLGIAFSLNHLGEVMRHIGEHERALEYYEQGLIYREGLYGIAGNPVRSFVNLGFTLHTLGQPDRAKEAFAKGLKNSLESGLGLKWTVETLIGLAATFAEEQQAVRAVQILGAVNNVRNVLGLSLMYQNEYDDLVSDLRADMDSALFDRIWIEGHSMSLDEVVSTVFEVVTEYDGGGFENLYD